MRSLCFLLLALLLPMPAHAASKPFQKIEACRWKADRWNDGDSFHVITGDAGKAMHSISLFASSGRPSSRKPSAAVRRR